MRRRRVDDANPFLSFRRALAWDAFAAAAGMTELARVALIEETDAAVAAVAGTGFRWTPFARSDGLSDALGFTATGGVWIKDETANVAGSHKARHLFTILLHLLTAERMGLAPWPAAAAEGGRPPLAIASCGNAALAAATLAAAAAWPIKVFVPPSANESVVARLTGLAAEIVVCPRRAGDPPGDPCVHRFRDAVAAGAVPFSVQGTENAWCLDGGRTIGWEVLYQAESEAAGEWGESATGRSGHPLDRVIVQVGGGAFAACCRRRTPRCRSGWTADPPHRSDRGVRAVESGLGAGGGRGGSAERSGAVVELDVAMGDRAVLRRRRHPRRRDLRLARRLRRHAGDGRVADRRPRVRPCSTRPGWRPSTRRSPPAPPVPPAWLVCSRFAIRSARTSGSR